MNSEEIAKNWVAKNQDTQCQVELWDSQAEDPVYNLMPTFQDNKFLQLLEQEHMLNENYDVLDIGCGVNSHLPKNQCRQQTVLCNI
jgi:hypothetical protein